MLSRTFSRPRRQGGSCLDRDQHVGPRQAARRRRPRSSGDGAVRRRDRARGAALAAVRQPRQGGAFLPAAVPRPEPRRLAHLLDRRAEAPATTTTTARRARSASARGSLFEDWFRIEEDGWVREKTTVHEAGGSFDFDAADIHGVRHPGATRRPSTSIHLYSPALWRMGHYEPGPRGMRRTGITYADELLDVV